MRMFGSFPRPRVPTVCLSYSPLILNFLDPYFIFMHRHNNHCHRVTTILQLIIIIIIIIIIKSQLPQVVPSVTTFPCYLAAVLGKTYIFNYVCKLMFPQRVLRIWNRVTTHHTKTALFLKTGLRSNCS